MKGQVFASLLSDEINMIGRQMTAYRRLLNFSVFFVIIFLLKAPAYSSGCPVVVNNKPGKQIAFTSRPLQDLMKAGDIGKLTPLEMAVLAKAIDLQSRHDGQIAIELMALGVPKPEVVELMKPLVDHDLRALEGDQTTLRLSFKDEPLRLNGPSSRQAARKDTPLTLEEFSKKFSLDDARVIVSQVATGPRNSTRGRSVLKAAFITEDPELIRRAVLTSLKYGNFDELIAMAAEYNHHSTLYQIGKICIARYLYFDRNHNWLDQGLRALTEIAGPDHEVVPPLLYDLFDLMTSNSILQNEGEIQMYDSPGQVDNYTGTALNVLVSALLPIRRSRYDSSSKYNYERKKTDDPNYKVRLHNLFNKHLPKERYFLKFSEAVSQLENPNDLLEIAEKASQRSREYPITEDRKLVESAMGLAFVATLHSGREAEITKMVQALLKDSRFGDRAFPLFYSTQQLPAEIVNLLKGFLENPHLLGENVSNPRLMKLLDFLKRSEDQSHVTAASSIFFAPSFRHEKGSIEYSLKRGNGASEAEIQGFIHKGEELIQNRDYFMAMHEFIAARDIPRLKVTYRMMMTDGRPLDAVYVGFAIEWIETGKSPFPEDSPEIEGTKNLKQIN